MGFVFCDLGYWILGIGWVHRPSCPCGGCGAGEYQGYFLDVLSGCGQQALASDLDQTSEPCVTMAKELFGVGEGSLDGFFSSLVNSLTPRGQSQSVGALAGVLPDMARDHAFGFGVGRARGQKRTGFAGVRVGCVLAIAGPVGG